MRLTAREWLFGLVGLIATAGIASWGIDQHDRRVTAAAQFADTIHRLNVRESVLEASIGDARLHVTASAETVTVTRTAYHQLRDTLVLYPVTPADTVKAVQALPVLVQRADDALRADSIHQVAATKLQAEIDSLVEALRDERDVLRAAKLYRPPRLTRTAAALYDPIAQTSAVSAQLAVRVVGSVSLVARADQRFSVGEKPRAYLGASVTF
jgi:hypothetical protein